LASLGGDWTRDLAGRTLGADRFATLFDTYLHNIRGYGPLRSREDNDWVSAHLVGYNRDPAWQFPALRGLLPRQAMVDPFVKTLGRGTLRWRLLLSPADWRG